MAGENSVAAPDGSVLSTLANGLNVLECLAAGRSSVRQVSEELKIPRQTVYRLLRTLSMQGWVDVNRDDDTYGLTSKVWSIASRSFRLTDVRDALSPMVKRLAEQYGETVHLATYGQGLVMYIDKADGWQPIRSYTELGGTAPAYCVATGKMLLALQPQQEIERVLAKPLRAYTTETIVDPERLRRQFVDFLDAGYAVNRSEWRDGVAGLAVPIAGGPTGERVALGFSGPQARIIERFDELLTALRGAALESPFMHGPIAHDSTAKGAAGRA